MKKPTMIIGKKQIILAGMTLILGLAVYINYAVSTSDGKIKATDVVKSQSVNYGDAQLVSTDSTSDYFAQARLNRSASRDEAVSTLQTIMGGGDLTEDERVTDALAAVETSQLIESESNIESMIKSMGYQECIVYLDGESAKVVVQTEGLDSAQAAAIKDVILGEISVPSEKIRIFEVK